MTREVQARGGISVKIMPVTAGVPDRLILLDGRLYLVETKTRGGRIRPAQALWHARAAEIGVEVAVLSSTEEVVNWLDSLR